MVNYQFNQPNATSMQELLHREGLRSAGVILRLAWQAGLLRNEIHTLTWYMVDTSAGALHLERRKIPIEHEMINFLRVLRAENENFSPYVVVSDRNKRQVTEQYISRVARQALDSVGLTAVRLYDLRHHYIVSQLETHDWKYVAQISGVEQHSLQKHFMPHADTVHQTTDTATANTTPLDEDKLWTILAEEGTSPVGLLLRLSWRCGLQLSEMLPLTWSQIDFLNGHFQLPQRTVQMDDHTRKTLFTLRERCHGQDGDHVILSQRAQKPLERAYSSRACRNALVKGGLPNATLTTLRSDYDFRTLVKEPVLALATTAGVLTRNTVMAHTGLTKQQAYHGLSKMVQEGSLILVGRKYTLPSQGVNPAQHTTAILDFLATEGSAVRQDIARLLGVEPRQAYPILRRMVVAKELTYRGGRYYLP